MTGQWIVILRSEILFHGKVYVTCSGCAGGSVSGHVSFDNSLIPASGTGIVNVALTWFAGASDDSIFHIMFGSQPLGFAFGDLHVLGGPSIQFKNGVFNGFLLVEDFIVTIKLMSSACRAEAGP